MCLQELPKLVIYIGSIGEREQQTRDGCSGGKLRNTPHFMVSAAEPESHAQQMVDINSRAGSGSSWTGWYLESPGLDPAVIDRVEEVPDGI